MFAHAGDAHRRSALFHLVAGPLADVARAGGDAELQSHSRIGHLGAGRSADARATQAGHQVQTEDGKTFKIIH